MGVSWELQGVRLVEHSDPIFLFVADAMHGRRAMGWNLTGIRTVMEVPGKVSGTMNFEKGEEHCSA